MAECRDFFDDERTSGVCRSSSFDDKQPAHMPPEGMNDVGVHCLELTLGLGPSVGGFRAPCPLPVRPASVYTCLPKQPSGNFAFPTSDALQTSFCQADAPKGLQNFSGEAEITALARQRSGNSAFVRAHTHPSFGGQADTGLPVKALLPSGDTAFPSRDQIWLTLQKNGSVSGQDAQHLNASSMWSRRSASMHVMIPRKEVGDSENDQIRRSWSSGVFPHTVSRQISSIESSLEKSPQENMVPSRDQDQEALEDLQKRKEMQAQRRQEARKRRKILIEEKQHKKSKQSSSLQRLGSRQSISPNEKNSLARTPTSEDGVTPESHCVSPNASKQEGQGNVRKGMIMMQKLHTEETKQETHSQCSKDDKIDMLASSIDEVEGTPHNMHLKGDMSAHGYYTTCSVPNKDGAMNWPSHEHNSGSNVNMVTTELEQSTSGGNCVMSSKFLTTGNGHNDASLHNAHAVMVATIHTGACTNEDEAGKPGDTECVESNSIRNNANLIQCASEKGGVGVMVSSALSTAPMASGSMSFPSFPFFAAPYPCTVAAALPTAIPIQPGFPFPFVMQHPGVDNDVSSLHGTCHVVTGMTPGKSAPGPLISKASSASNDCMGESFEGKGGTSENSAFTSLSRTTSNLKHVKEELQYLGVQLESQVTVPASQLSALSSVVSDACNTKNLLLDGQQSMPLGGRLLSQNSSVLDQSPLSSKQERPILTQRGIDVQHERSTLRMDAKAKVKQVEGIKQEEGNTESQLASEHSGMDTSYVQSASVERQKSGPFPDLPWVTTTGKGPNGKTISGVMYIVNGRHVRLVCSCHGKHMSPVEFVEHSGSTDLSNPERSIVARLDTFFQRFSLGASLQA